MGAQVVKQDIPGRDDKKKFGVSWKRLAGEDESLGIRGIGSEGCRERGGECARHRSGMRAELVDSENVAHTDQGLSRDAGTCAQDALVQALGGRCRGQQGRDSTYVFAGISTSLTPGVASRESTGRGGAGWR